MKYIIFLIILVLITVFCIYQNNHLDISIYSYSNPKIPTAMNHLKILQVSDFHNKQFGNNQKDILNKINKIDPDLIFITGDLIDRRRYNLEVALEFIKGLHDYDVYYIPGNHEAWSNQYDEIQAALRAEGVHVLNDESVFFERLGSKLEIVGLRDLGFYNEEHGDDEKTNEYLETVKTLSRPDFQILLSHRPDLIDIYQNNGYDLVFSGHAHGGQIRLPLVGALFAPNQGLLPKYTEGFNECEDTTMVVSRGLGNSLFPLRVFNHPELVVVVLNNK